MKRVAQLTSLFSFVSFVSFPATCRPCKNWVTLNVNAFIVHILGVALSTALNNLLQDIIYLFPPLNPPPPLPSDHHTQPFEIPPTALFAKTFKTQVVVATLLEIALHEKFRKKVKYSYIITNESFFFNPIYAKLN